MTALKRTRRQIRNWISRRPYLYLSLARPAKGDFVVGPKTDIVVEGFPRSGNSFAEAALRVAAGRSLNMAHHCHAAAQLHGAARWNIPALVVMREPLGACASLMMHNGSLFNAREALEEYIMFHEDILPVRNSFVLAEFKTITSNFLSVLEALDCRFETKFVPGDSDLFSEQAVFNMLDETSLKRGRVDAAGEPYSPRRTKEDKELREAQKAQMRGVFEQAELQILVAQAKTIYAELSAGRDV